MEDASPIQELSILSLGILSFEQVSILSQFETLSELAFDRSPMTGSSLHFTEPD